MIKNWSQTKRDFGRSSCSNDPTLPWMRTLEMEGCFFFSTCVQKAESKVDSRKQWFTTGLIWLSGTRTYRTWINWATLTLYMCPGLHVRPLSNTTFSKYWVKPDQQVPQVFRGPLILFGLLLQTKDVMLWCKVLKRFSFFAEWEYFVKDSGNLVTLVRY